MDMKSYQASGSCSSTRPNTFNLVLAVDQWRGVVVRLVLVCHTCYCCKFGIIFFSLTCVQSLPVRSCLSHEQTVWKGCGELQSCCQLPGDKDRWGSWLCSLSLSGRSCWPKNHTFSNFNSWLSKPAVVFCLERMPLNFIKPDFTMLFRKNWKQNNFYWAVSTVLNVSGFFSTVLKTFSL